MKEESMNRRGFLKSMLAAGVAPYVVTSAGVLMPVKKILTATAPEIAFVQSGPGATPQTFQEALRLWGDGIHDDTAALQAWLDGSPVIRGDGSMVGRVLYGGSYRVSGTIYMREDQPGRELFGNEFHGPVAADKPMFVYSRNEPLPLKSVTFFNVTSRSNG
jgi:hypothetical protein